MSSNLKESESHVSSELQISKHPKSQAGHDKLSHLKPLPTACADAKQLRITPRCKCSKMAAKCGHSHCHSCFQFVFPRYNHNTPQLFPQLFPSQFLFLPHLLWHLAFPDRSGRVPRRSDATCNQRQPPPSDWVVDPSAHDFWVHRNVSENVVTCL